jgi:hypothetical protein
MATLLHTDLYYLQKLSSSSTHSNSFFNVVWSGAFFHSSHILTE